MTSSKAAVSKLSFYWRSPHSKESFVSICEAVCLGYNTNESLLKALPQFSINRLVLGLDRLIAANMAHLNMGVLTVDTDMQIVEALAAGQVLELPLAAEQLERNALLIHEILAGIGVDNPAGAMVLLKPKVEEI
ncbi:hypothetical protein [Bowmanella yangjiangensis]|uniref:Uncharacterized protein n=1 Tax=Bowmanella yangjiangensis TaxID=2811230 RepID=A0ABS3CYZ4_9ALTE|nr:hypothetical protein [Bowmanella yangjiangensis]MBN7822338.1 hypothetical protein [Bowmanella yangjiangensis]